MRCARIIPTPTPIGTWMKMPTARTAACFSTLPEDRVVDEPAVVVEAVSWNANTLQPENEETTSTPSGIKQEDREQRGARQDREQRSAGALPYGAGSREGAAPCAK